MSPHAPQFRDPTPEEVDRLREKITAARFEREERLRAAETRKLRVEDVERLEPNRRTEVVQNLREIALLLRLHLLCEIDDVDAEQLLRSDLITRFRGRWRLTAEGHWKLRQFALEHGSR